MRPAASLAKLRIAATAILVVAVLAVADLRQTLKIEGEAFWADRRCINIGNRLEAPREGEWGGPLDISVFPALRTAGFNTIRLPVRWDTHTGPPPAFPIDPAYLARVQEVVGAALDADLAVVLNVHHFDPLYAEPERYAPQFLAIWQQIADHFAAADARLALELINEPRAPLEGKALEALQAQAHRRIRERHPERWIMVTGGDWSTIHGLKALRFHGDQRTVLTFHDYAPFDFTHQGAHWAPPDIQKVTRSWPQSRDREDVKARMNTARTLKQRFHRPVFLGEFGAIQGAEGRDAYLEAVRDAAEAHGIGWCVWSLTADFGVFDAASGRLVPEAQTALGLGRR